MTHGAPRHPAPASPFIGRKDELSVLRRSFEASVQGGETKVVVLSGEAGLGKSRLLKQFTDELAGTYSPSPICGYGQALSVGVATEAFGAVRECLRSIVASRGDAKVPHLKVIGEALRESAPAWLEAIPMVGQLLAAGVQTSQAITNGREIAVLDLASPVDQFVGFIRALTAETPVVLVLDDLHWADNATIELAMRLALQNVGPLLLVMSYRVTPGLQPSDSDRAIRDARNNILRYRADAVAIDLGRLDDPTLLAALGARLESQNRSMPPKDLRRIVALSGGNPLVAECLLLTYGDEDLASFATPSDPNRIGAIMDIGLSRLDPAESQFLEACATVGPIFDAVDVARTLKVTEDQVLDLIDLLSMKATLIDDVPAHRDAQRFKFHHPILAEVLRERAKDQYNRWRRMNARLVDSASELAAETEWDAALLARMAGYAVEAQREEEAFRWALAASREQLRLGSFSTALGTARAAIASAKSPQDALEARLVLIEGLQTYADHDEVVQVCEAALVDAQEAGSALASPRVFSAIRLHRLRGLRMTGNWTIVSADLPGVIDELALEGDPLLAQARMLLAEMQLCGPDQDLMSCKETLESLRELQLDPATRSRTIGHLGLVALARHDPVAAQTLLEEAINLGLETERPYDRYETLHWMSKKQMACLELDAAAESIRHLQEISERHGVAGDTPFHDRDLSRVLGLLGRVEEAAPLSVRYFDSSGSPDGVVVSTIAFQVAELAEVRSPREADEFLRSFDEHAPGHMYDSSRRELATKTVRILSAARDLVGTVKDPGLLEVSAADHKNAFDIFTFNVPALNKLRQKHA